MGPNAEIQTCQNSGGRDMRLDSRGNWVECALREGSGWLAGAIAKKEQSRWTL